MGSKMRFAAMAAVSASAMVAMLATTTAEAAAPGTMAVEGVLSSAGGGAAADGIYDATFAIYNVKQGGSAAWMEGPLKIGVTNGRFVHVLGTVKPIGASVLAQLSSPWLGVKIGDEPEFPRRALRSVAYALLADVAHKLACSGCVDGKLLANGAVGADKVGFTYAGAKTKGGPANAALTLACTGCVTVDKIKFDKDVDLGGNALKAKAIAAASVSAGVFQGDGSKLTGIKIPSGECKVAGEVVKGINPDGTLKCVKAMDASALPADGIDEISNSLIHNQFENTDCLNKSVPIQDNNPIGVGAELIFGDYGLAQKLDVLIDVSNSDIKTVIVKLWDPNNKEYLLWDKTGPGKTLSGVWPSKTKVLKGDLTGWVNKNPKGKWRIQVIDGKFLNNAKDGAVTKFCVKIKTLSNQKINVQGDLIVGTDKLARNLDVKGSVALSGGLKLGTTSAKCAAATKGTLRYDKTYGLEVCNGSVWHAAYPKPIIYRGYCSKHGHGAGWVKYCLNGTILNTAQKYLKIVNNEVQFLIPGYYRMDFWTISTTGNYPHIEMFRRNAKGSNTRLYFAHEYSGNQWDDNMGQVVHAFNTNERYWLQIHDHGGGNNYAYHHGNATGTYGNLTVTYLGPLKP